MSENLKRKRNTVHMLGNLSYGDLNFKHDERLERRFKRRCAAMNITLKNHCPKSNTGVERSLNNVPKREVSVGPDHALSLNVREDDCVDYDDDDDDNDDDHDPDYVMCLKHLREYGSSYALVIAVNDGMSMFVKYEDDDEFNDDLNPLSLKCSKDFPSGDKVETKRVLRNIGRDKKKESSKTLKNVPSKGRNMSMTEDDAQAECWENCSTRQKPFPKVCYSSMPEIKHDMGSVMEDDSYKEFMNSLELDGDTLVLMNEDGKQIRYEDGDEIASDSESVIVATDDVPHCDDGIHSPFVPSKIYHLDCKESSSRTSSKFRETLMDILKKPFDKKEYEELFQDASNRKPLERHIELRRGVTKRCPIIGSLSKSYLDHYTDLKNEIDSVRRSHYIVLNLLRGFFYWLKNLSQEGAFRPWLDESCLKLIRRL